MIGRIVIYGLLIGALMLLASDPLVKIIGGPLSVSSPSGGFSVTDPSPIYIVPIALLIWVVLRRRKQRSDAAKYED